MENHQIKAVSKVTQAKFMTVDTLEYMVSLIVGGAFLAHLTQTIGIPDSIGGVISSFVSLAGISQLLSMMIIRPGMKMKGYTTSLVIINQFLWALFYLIPLPILPFSSGTRIALFMILKLVANILLKMCYPTKFVWQTYYVEEHKIGIYNATKEMISLIFGMLFSLGIGVLSDRMEAAGRMDDSFILCSVFIAIISTAESILLISVKEPRVEGKQNEHHKLSEPFKATFGNSKFRKIICVIALYSFFTYFSTSFLGVYQTGSLGFSLTYCQIITFIGMSTWAALARYAGKLAQKLSWTRVVIIFMSIYAMAFFVNIFTVPSNGRIVFMVYSLLHYIAMAGIKLPLLAFEYVDTDNRTGAVSITQAFGGVCGFVGSLCGAWVLDKIEGNGNRIFGINAYPQQVLSVISFLGLTFTVIILYNITRKLKKESIKN